MSIEEAIHEFDDASAVLQRWIREVRENGHYPENDGQTHHATCWRTRGHHECAIKRVKELEAQVILEMANTTQQAMRVEELEAECPLCAASELKATNYERQVLELRKAIDRSGFNLYPCMSCGEPVVCIPDGIPMCEKCASNEGCRHG